MEIKCKCGHSLFNHHHFVNIENYIGGGTCRECYCEEFVNEINDGEKKNG